MFHLYFIIFFLFCDIFSTFVCFFFCNKNFLQIKYYYIFFLSLIFCSISFGGILYFLKICSYGWFFFIHKIWFSFLNVSIFYSFYLNFLGYLMLIVIYFISMFVHLYSLDYMKFDYNSEKFIILLSIFTYFMNLLLIVNNGVLVFFAWEGVGLCSYLLISFWQSRLQAIKSAMKAMLVNKVGDIFLLCSFLLMYNIVDTMEINFLDYLFFTESTQIITIQFFFYNLKCTYHNLLVFCMIIAAFTKSAQIFLHVWLPDAMEGPTPVSALIHAATMVAAGIFLLVRFFFLLFFNCQLMLFISFIGAFTIVMFSRIAILQKDIKKIIAFSTCSQLGYMFLACGFGFFSYSIFHLTMHAFYKALLFLCAGSIISGMQDEQDIRKISNLYQVLPVTYITMIIGVFALGGFPFFSGFFSKDMIIYISTFKNILFNFNYYFSLLGSAYTLYYCCLLIYFNFFSFFGYPRLQPYIFSYLEESKGKMLVTLIILSICSIISGYYFKHYFIVMEYNIQRLFVIAYDLSSYVFVLKNLSFFYVV